MLFSLDLRKEIWALLLLATALLVHGSPEDVPVLSKRKITQQDRTFYKFNTRPDIDAPVFNVKIHDENSLADGYWFIAPYGQLGQDRPGQHWDGPHIYDGKGELVWSGTPMFGYWNIFDLESRIVNDEPMITLLSDHEKHGFILNSSYEIYRMVPLLHGDQTKLDFHEFNVFDNGRRALILTHTTDHASIEASKVVGFDGHCNAKYQGFREVDVDSPGSKSVIFDWDSSRHIGLDEVTYRKYDGSIEQQCNRGWDILHLNSIVKFPDGDYLLSARHTDTLYKISHKDGSIVWRLGGVKSDFQQNEWQFSRQHHALVLEQNDTNTLLTVFDNGIGDGPFNKKTSDHARGLIISLDTKNMKAEVLAKYVQPRGERTNARGSFQTLPNGNKFLCWAYNSLITEHTPDGSLVMEASIPIKLRSYRAFKHPWVGQPTASPDIVSETVSLDNYTMTVVHVSWNGDTRATEWKFYEVDHNGKTSTLGSTKRKGFETRFEHKGFSGRVSAEAFDADGHSLGKSRVVDTPAPLSRTESVHPPETFTEAEQEHEAPSVDSVFRIWNMTFLIGLGCGIGITALLWAGMQVYMRGSHRKLRNDHNAKYMPLKELDEAIED